MDAFESTPFDLLEKAFAALGRGVAPVVLDGQAIGWRLPARAIPLPEVRAVLLHPSTSNAARDAALGVLVDNAQRRGGVWTVAVAGVLLPGLRRAARPLLFACPTRLTDVQAEMLVGLLEAVDGFVPGTARAAARLVWAARRRGHRLVVAELAQHTRVRPATVEPPRQPWGHPDVVLERAVAEGVIETAEAELIGETRIGQVPLRQLAQAWGLPYAALQKRRRRAELRLARWLGWSAEVASPGLSANRPRERV